MAIKHFSTRLRARNSDWYVAITLACVVSFASPPGAVANGSTFVWPPGTWLTNPGPQNFPGTGFAAAFGTAYFSPVLLPANRPITKLAFALVNPPEQGQKARICLYTSNIDGLPLALIVDGGEVNLVQLLTIANFAAVTPGQEAIYWVMIELKQPISALLYGSFPLSSGVVMDDSALPGQFPWTTLFGYTYTAPMTYGACPAIAPVVSQNSNATLSTWVGH